MPKEITGGHCLMINGIDLTSSWSGTIKWEPATSYQWTINFPQPKNYKPIKVVFVEGLLAKVYFDDDSVFVVNCLPEDEKFFSEEIATALAIQKKIFNDSKTDRSIRKYINKIAVRHPRITEKEKKTKKKAKK